MASMPRDLNPNPQNKITISALSNFQLIESRVDRKSCRSKALTRKFVQNFRRWQTLRVDLELRSLTFQWLVFYSPHTVKSKDTLVFYHSMSLPWPNQKNLSNFRRSISLNSISRLPICLSGQFFFWSAFPSSLFVLFSQKEVQTHFLSFPGFFIFSKPKI